MLPRKLRSKTHPTITDPVNLSILDETTLTALRQAIFELDNKFGKKPKNNPPTEYIPLYDGLVDPDIDTQKEELDLLIKHIDTLKLQDLEIGVPSLREEQPTLDDLKKHSKLNNDLDEGYDSMTKSRNGWFTDPKGTKQHYVDGLLHDDPAVGYAEVRVNGTIGRYKNGLIHSDSGPAFTTRNGTIKYAVDGKYHRLGGLPAVTWSKSKYHQEFWENGEIQRAILNDGTIEYYAPGCTDKKDAVLSRRDGPAVINSNGTAVYFIDGVKFVNQTYYEDALNRGFKHSKIEANLDNLNTSKVEIEPIDSESNYTTTKETKKMSKPSITEVMKSNAVSAGYRVAATQSTVLVRNAIVNIMKNKGADEGALKGISAFLDTELGAAILSLAIGTGLNYVPTIGDDSRVQRLAEEMRINSFATAGNLVVGEAMNHLLPALSQVIQSLPAVETPTTVTRVEDTKSKLSEALSNEQQSEEENSEVRTMTANG